MKKSEKKSKTVTCIVPAYNEAPRIGDVLNVVCSYSGFDEVIVVDDASTDSTAEVAAAYHPTKLIRLSTNRGKAGAVLAGFAACSGDIIVLLDSDLVGLTHNNLTTLLTPALAGDTLTISLRGNGWLFHRMTGLDPWSGERAFPRSILEQLRHRDFESSGYTLESYINDIAITSGVKILSVFWPNVSYILKQDKIPGFSGLLDDILMYFQIYTSFGIGKTLYQQFYLPLQVRRSSK